MIISNVSTIKRRFVDFSCTSFERALENKGKYDAS